MVAMKQKIGSKELFAKHYESLKKLKFYDGLVAYMATSPVVAMVWEGLGVVKTGRLMLGETDPAKSLPGTIRGDYCIEIGRNICHGSDSVASANDEIALWFDDSELCHWTPSNSAWIYE
ncbi:unnamed protein product [Owenia fusiformis]|uniref:Nucleoside diphosphate kinase n=1 Tax=Owenia fusiformis TaxID=6347 RepID=A0A8S4NE56_OWEFU|nr:unnamed protein product [Owenia fusiformis]